MPSDLPQAPFLDSHTAQGNWLRLQGRLPAPLRTPLAPLLAESPDPDGALNLLERYVRAAPPDLLDELSGRPAALTYLIAAFGFGGLLSKAFLAEPALALQFARDRQFVALKSCDDLREDYARFSATQASGELSTGLVRFKRRNEVRIALKDVLGLATLAETTLELSDLADVLVAEALRDADRGLEKRFGQPQYRDTQGRVVRSGFSVISLGKLGGSELNYSSDIDLLFLYARDGETAGAGRQGSAISNKEYFVRLAQAVTGRLTEVTAEGQVFRVDLRLRPEGDQGDLTLSLNAALDYYARRAAGWELQMLIKARHSAGDARLTRAFLRGVEGCVYSSPGDFAAVASVLASRERISRLLRGRRRESIDVKRQSGGIRDIEFLTQCLQRLYGAREPWVRSGGTLHALRKLNDKALLSDRDYGTLASAYAFLRKVEHRIQLDRGQQAHHLPADPRALERLARRVGFEAGEADSAGNALTHRLNRVFGEVEEVYRRLLRPGDAGRGPGAFELSAEATVADPSGQSLSSILGLLGPGAVEVGALVAEHGDSRRVPPRVARFIAALRASPDAISLARESPKALERALEVVRISEPLGDSLIRHPEDLAVLAALAPEPVSEAQMSIPLRSEGAAGWGPAPAPAFAWVNEPSLDLRSKMGMLRRNFRARALQLGAGDCTRMAGVDIALRRWSDLAASCVSTAFAIAAEMCGLDLAPAGGQAAQPVENPRVAVLGMGRLGLNEFDLGSDADLIFVAAPQADPEELRFAARWAERTLEALSSYTRDGAVFAVDARLRPRGNEGELVVSEDTLLDYALREAQPWEALSYLKACPVAGNSELGWDVTERLAQALFAHFAGDPQLAAALRDMRRRLEREPKTGRFSTKSAPGGYYDVDFAVSYLRLRHRLAQPAGTNMHEQIRALEAAGLLSESDAETLAAGAAYLRTLDHAIRLVTGKRLRSLPERPGSSQAIGQLLRLWGVSASGEPKQVIATELAQVKQRVRGVFSRVLGPE